MPEPATYSLVMPSDPGKLSTARDFVANVAHCCRLESSATHALVLATGEAISNIIRHAHRSTQAALIEVRVEVGAEVAVLSFLDEGEPFDVASVPQLCPGEMRIGGRGVYLMRMLMDELSCLPRESGKGNCLRMVKRLGR